MSELAPIRARWARVTTSTRLALLVIAVQLAVRAWVILPGAYFQDDFVFLRYSREEPLGLDLLLRAPNGHLSPGTQLTAWVFTRFPGSYLPAALDLMVLQALASIFLWLLLRRLVGDRMSAVLGLAVASFTPLMLTTVSWWAAGEIMLALQLAMCVGGYCHLRLVQGGTWWWLLGALCAMAFGLFFGEKSVFVPVFMFLITVLLVSDGGRVNFARILRLWPAWTLYAGLVGGYLIVYLRYADIGDASVRSVASASGIARAQVIDVFARGIIGGPWSGSIATSGQWLPISVGALVVIVQVFAAVAILAYRTAGSRSLVAWAVLAIYLALNVALTARGRGFFATLIQYDPRYICDAIPMAAAAAAVMFRPAPNRTARMPRWAAERPVVLAGVAVLVLFNSSMVSTGRVARALHHSEVTSYVENARASVLKDPGIVLYDGFVPQSAMIALFPENEKRVSSVLAAYDVDAHFDRPSSDMKILDDTGVARSINLMFTQNGVFDTTNDCGVAVSPGRTSFVSLDSVIPKGRWVMRVDYFTSTATSLAVATSGDGQPVGFLPGPRSVFMIVQGGGSLVGFASGDRNTGTVCVTGVTIGLPTPGTP